MGKRSPNRNPYKPWARSAQERAARDQEVLRRLAEGATVAEVAAAMTYSASLIKMRIRKMRIAAGARTQTQLVAMAVARGLEFESVPPRA